MKNSIARTVFAGLLAVSAPALFPADGSKPAGQAPAAADRLDHARQLIASKQWPAAISELRRINATQHADWNNLMGYSHRKADPPDLPTAERYYRAALAINPKHLGTLEYLGEMRLQQGDLAGAEQQLAALKSATFLRNREYKELQAAIGRYKASGNTYIPSE